MLKFLYSLAEVSAAMAAVITLLLLLKPLLSKRYAARWRYWVWLAVAVRLLLPLNFSLLSAPVRLAAPAGRTISLPREVTSGASNADTAAHAGVSEGSSVPAGSGGQTGQDLGEKEGGGGAGEAPESALHTLTPEALLPFVYFTGVVSFLLWQLISRRRFLSYVRRWSVPPSPDQLALFEEEKLALNIESPVRLTVCPGVGGPMLTGLFRPAVLLPGEISHLSLVLRHELTHLKRRDLWYKLLLLLASAVHWFNPVVWLMARAASADLELVCDDMTVEGLGADGNMEYGDAILSALKKGRTSPLSTGFRGGARTVAERLRNLASGTKKRGLAALTAAVLVVALAAGLVACGSSGGGGSVSTPIPDGELESLIAAEYQGTQEGDTWKLLLSRPGKGCTLGVVRYASASHAGGLGNLIFGVFDNATKKPAQPVITFYGDKSDCGLWWEEDAPDTVLLPYTVQTIYQGAEAGSAGLLSFDGSTLKTVTELPAAARGEDLTLPEGAENMLDLAKNGDFWRNHKAVLSCSTIFELFSTNPDWEAARPEEGVRQWVYEGCVPLGSAHPPLGVLEAARRYFEEVFRDQGPYSMSSSDYPIAVCSPVTDYTDLSHPGALAYNVDLYDEDQGYLERLFLFDGGLSLLGVRSNLDYSLRFNSVRYRLGEEKTGLFGTPSATNRTVLSDGAILYSEWFGEDYSTGCDYIYDPDTGTYSLCNLVTNRLNASTNRGKGAAIHIGSTLAELIEAYPELDTEFTPQTSCLTLFEPILGGGGCRIEFYFEPNGGLPEPREDTLARTVDRICIAAPEW